MQKPTKQAQNYQFLFMDIIVMMTKYVRFPFCDDYTNTKTKFSVGENYSDDDMSGPVDKSKCCS